jgi:hypothetical protein
MQIEKGKPMPGSRDYKGRQRYMFADMEVGDSIFIEGQTSYGSAATSAKQHGKRKGKRFTSRTEEGGVRIWRVA